MQFLAEQHVHCLKQARFHTRKNAAPACSLWSSFWPCVSSAHALAQKNYWWQNNSRIKTAKTHAIYELPSTMSQKPSTNCGLIIVNSTTHAANTWNQHPSDGWQRRLISFIEMCFSSASISRVIGTVRLWDQCGSLSMFHRWTLVCTYISPSIQDSKEIPTAIRMF